MPTAMHQDWLETEGDIHRGCASYVAYRAKRNAGVRLGKNRAIGCLESIIRIPQLGPIDFLHERSGHTDMETLKICYNMALEDRACINNIIL